MTNQEFSDEFDVLYNNIMSNQAPGLDEYEKSVFLTKAVKEVIKNYFRANGNTYQEGFDNSQKRQIDFSTIIVTTDLSSVGKGKYDTRGYSYETPTDLFLFINEYLTDSSGRRYQVIPITFEEYLLNMSKPYGYPPKRQAWRLIVDSYVQESATNSRNIVCEVIGRFTLAENETPVYHVRYVKNPSPIILVNLQDINEGLTIDGRYEETQCDLPTELHPEVLQRAVEIAKATYAGDVTTVMTTGARTE